MKHERLHSDPRRSKAESRKTVRRTHGGDVVAFARERGVTQERVLDFSASINPLGSPSAATAAYKRAVSGLSHYPQPYADTLVSALAAYHGLASSTILAGNGSTHLIYLLARVFASQRVLCIAPLFSEHGHAFHLGGARVDHLVLRPPRFSLSLDRLRTVLNVACDMLVLTNPNSPTGQVMPQEQVRDIVRLCRQTQTRLLIDETFMDWLEEESIKHLATRNRQLIVLRSLTKFFALPGLRVGYLIACPSVVRLLRKHLEPWSVNSVAIEVACACLQDQGYVRHSRTFMIHERAWLRERLGKVPNLSVFPSQANFLLTRLATQTIAAPQLAKELEQQNILIRPCEDFRGLDTRFFRVAVRLRKENGRLLTALRKVLGNM